MMMPFMNSPILPGASENPPLATIGTNYPPEERERRERAAHWLLRTRGYMVLQRGQFRQT